MECFRDYISVGVVINLKIVCIEGIRPIIKGVLVAAMYLGAIAQFTYFFSPPSNDTRPAEHMAAFRSTA